MEDREALHTLVDELPEPELSAAKRFLEYLRQAADPVRLALDSAPVDDEPLTEDDLAAIREGFADRAEGKTVSHDEVKRLLGARGRSHDDRVASELASDARRTDDGDA